jgi:hypothetical protein
MERQEALSEVANLRLRFQINRRLRLESLAALSKVFREHGESLNDDLLASIVFAVPEELLGEGGSHETTMRLDNAEDIPSITDRPGPRPEDIPSITDQRRDRKPEPRPESIPSMPGRKPEPRPESIPSMPGTKPGPRPESIPSMPGTKPEPRPESIPSMPGRTPGKY